MICKCFSYFSQNLAPSLLSSKNFSSFARMAILPRCPRAAAALPKTFARCNTARAYPVLQRYNHLHFPISCRRKKHQISECLNHPQNEQKCPTGDIAPIPRDSCCPSKAECDNKNCSQVIERREYLSFFPRPYFLLKQSVSMCVFEQVRCIVERCDDGSIAPVPEGQCCPSKRACPAQVLVLSN